MLGGSAPRRGGRWTRPQRRHARQRQGASTVLLMLAFALFVLGAVGGFAWSADRQLRGGLLRQEATADADAREDRVRLAELPAYVQHAFVAVVEPAAAGAGRVRPDDSGTTLARELVTQVHLLSDGLGGQARALVMAPLLEQRTVPGRTLEMFLNRVRLGEHRGHEVYGLWHASREYFDKAPQSLTLSEAATLAGLLLPPRIEVPQREVGAVGVRRNEVLEVMLRGGLISQDDYREAVSEPLRFQPGIGDMPMTRPFDWGEREPIRLPIERRPTPVPEDSLR